MVGPLCCAGLCCDTLCVSDGNDSDCRAREKSFVTSSMLWFGRFVDGNRPSLFVHLALVLPVVWVLRLLL